MLRRSCRSQYSIAFYENRTGKGDYNLDVEVGSALGLRRRLAIIKDEPVERLPTDLVGRVFKEVELDKPATVVAALHKWCRDDLNIGSCVACPK